VRASGNRLSLRTRGALFWRIASKMARQPEVAENGYVMRMCSKLSFPCLACRRKCLRTSNFLNAQLYGSDNEDQS